MKTGMFLLFFSIVLLVYFLVNFYIYQRGLQLLPQGNAARPWFKILFWLVTSSYIVGRIVERYHISLFTDVLTWVGSFWLAAMLLLFMLVIMADIIRVANHFTGFFPALFYTNGFKFNLFIGTLAFVFLAVLGGHINAITPNVTKLNIKLDKPAGRMQELRIALASDIHMGTVIGPRRMTKLVNKINALKPDIILFAGDVVDEDLAPVVRHDLGNVLIKLKAPLGVFAITGNHEYIGGVEKAVAYLKQHGIIMLRDSAITINGSFVLAGREDRSKSQRKSINDILAATDRTLPIIMMDHQPFDLDSVTAQNIDIQFSGHTHHGQMWPLNYITQAIYEVSRGYKQKGSSHFYVSNGFGTWGPPVRIGNRPEIVEVIVTFRQ